MAALMLKTVFEQTRDKYELKILAGEAGLSRSLRWLYFCEDIENENFLRGGELMVLTGHGFRNRDHFEAFIQMLIRKHSCGAIVNVGKYIFEHEISETLRARCEEAQFPLITMPWKYHLTDIMQDYSRQIFFRTHEQDRLACIFQTLLRNGDLDSQQDEASLAAYQFDPAGIFSVAAIIFEPKKGAPSWEMAFHDLRVLAENHLNQTGEKVCVFSYQNQLVMVFHREEHERTRVLANEILDLAEQNFPKYQFFCGVGSALTGVRSIRESYMRAWAAVHWGKSQGVRLLTFRDMGIFQLFFTCRDEAVLKELTGVLTPLEDYDTNYGTQLVDTLRHYLHFNGSVNLVSDALFCHRNTTNYRIKKIKDLLGSDLEERNIRFQLQMAFHVQEYRTLFF